MVDPVDQHANRFARIEALPIGMRIGATACMCDSTRVRWECPAFSRARTGQYNDHMVKKMTATEVKARILALLDDVTSGDEVEITKHGRVVARLIPARDARPPKGTLAGVAMTASGYEEDLFATGAAWDLPQQ
jgi:prevent-host-death family protein